MNKFHFYGFRQKKRKERKEKNQIKMAKKTEKIYTQKIPNFSICLRKTT